MPRLAWILPAWLGTAPLLRKPGGIAGNVYAPYAARLLRKVCLHLHVTRIDGRNEHLAHEADTLLWGLA